MGSGVQVERLALERTIDNLSIVTESEKAGRGVEGLNREKEAYQNLDIQTFLRYGHHKKTTFLFIPLHKRNHL